MKFPATNLEKRRLARERYAATQVKTAELRADGYTVVEEWECQWRALAASDRLAQSHVTTYPLQRRGAMTHASIVAGVEDGSLFGLIEVDISVKAEHREYFAEMQPIFKNTNVSRADVGPTMRAFVESLDTLKTPRRALVSSYFGKKVLMISPLLQWYLKTGKMEITHIYQVVQYLPAPCFEEFGESVSDARRSGDADPDQSIVADTMKLLGNSAYGEL